MTEAAEQQVGKETDPRPYGAQRDLAPTPIYMLMGVYAVWMVVLIWMAVFTLGR